MTYKIRKDGAVLKFNDDDSVSVLSPDPTNHLTAAYLAWVAAGNDAGRLETIEQRRADRLRELDAFTQARILTETQYDGHWYQCDMLNRTRIMKMGTLSDAQLAGLNQSWRCLDGARPTVTKALVTALDAAFVQHELICLAVSDAHKDGIEASDDPESYDITTGWPARYEPQ